MPDPRHAARQSTEDLRTLYRALGVSEQTLARAIQYSEARSDGLTPPELPKIRRRRGRQPQNAPCLGQAEPAGRLSALREAERGVVKPRASRAIPAGRGGSYIWSAD
jgi:hypothetical protein